MKQLVQHLDSGETALIDAPRPRPGPHEVLIRASCSVVSTGTERMLVSFGRAGLVGKARQQPGRVAQVMNKAMTDGVGATLRAVRSKLGRPLPLGYSMAGVIEEVGAEVRDLLPGDRVVSNGPHADEVLASRRLVSRVPDGVTDEQAAFTVLGAVALHGVREASPELGEVFVVVGLGVVGLLTVQLLRAHGCQVIGADLNPARTALAQRFGATHTALAGRDDLPTIVRDVTGQRGADGVLLCLDTERPEPLRQAIEMCRARGRVILVGQTPVRLERDQLYNSEVMLRTSRAYGPGRHDPRVLEDGLDYPIGHVRWTPERNFEAVLGLMARGALDVAPLIAARVPFHRAASAYDAIVRGHDDAVATLFTHGTPEPPPPTPWRMALTPTSAGARLGSIASIASRATALVRRESEERPLRVGVIGAGNYADQVFFPALQAAEIEPVVIAAPSALGATLVGRRFGAGLVTTRAEEVIEDDTLDAVFILTRHDSHAALASAALAEGRHVYVEKPLARTPDELAQVRAALERFSAHARPLLMVGFNRRFAPQVRELHARLADAAGPKNILITVNAGRLPDDHWLNGPAQGGRLIGEVCHFIDLARALAGRPVRDAHIAGDMQAGVSITLDFGDHTHATILYAVAGHSSYPKERVEVFCSGAVHQIDNFRVMHAFGAPAVEGVGGWRQDKGHGGAVQAFLDAVRHVQRDVRAVREAPIPLDELLEVTRLTMELDARVRS